MRFMLITGWVERMMLPEDKHRNIFQGTVKVSRMDKGSSDGKSLDW